MESPSQYKQPSKSTSGCFKPEADFGYSVHLFFSSSVRYSARSLSLSIIPVSEPMNRPIIPLFAIANYGIMDVMVRLYRGLLILYPAEFREEYGRELCLAFTDRCRAQHSRLGVLMVWIHAAFGVLAEAPKEHYHVMLQDIRHALRVMWKDASITAAAIAILALGIGATTTVFSLVNGILVRPLPYPEPDRLVAVAEYNSGGEFGRAVAFPNYQDIRARTRLLQDIGLYSEGQTTIRGEGEAEEVPTAFITDGVFSVLGVRPILGTVVSRQQDVPNGPPVVVIGQDLWQRRYAVIGASLERPWIFATCAGPSLASCRPASAFQKGPRCGYRCN